MLFCKRFFLLLFLLCTTFFTSAQITIRVVAVPENTPPDASLYLVGNFNNWTTGDSLYKMTKQSSGVFSFTFLSWQDSLAYKVVRNNSWHTVEGRSNGRAKPNRITINKSKTPLVVDIKIASWEDLSGHSLSAYILILIVAAIQGFILIMAINKLQNNNRKANSILSAILLLVSFSLLGRVAVNYRDIFSETPSVYLASDIVLFSYAPLFYAYLQELLTIQVKIKSKWLPFVPFLIHTILYTYLILLPKQTFIDHMVDNDFMWIFASVGVISLGYNMIYWIKSLEILRIYKSNVAQTHSFDQNLTYLNSVFIVQGLCLLAWLFVFLYSALGWIFNYNYLTITEYSIDAVWILFSAITYCLGYFAMNQPAIFKLSAVAGIYQTSATPEPEIFELPEPVSKIIITNKNSDVQEYNMQNLHIQSAEFPQTGMQEIKEQGLELEMESQPIEKQILVKEATIYPQPYGTPVIQPFYTKNEEKNEFLIEKQLDIEPYKQQLELLIRKEKPYLEPQLTLPELATQMHISLHLLSKVINDGYDKNFHDFINFYRIEEFKLLIIKPKYKNQTILAVALDAGFNSKTAFNRAFKKLTNSTPREFLKQQSLEGKINMKYEI